MTTRYTRLTGGFLGVLLALLTGGWSAAQAQTGTYGHEWIVPSQSYYKIKITKDAIYRLDQAYLTQAGLGTANPQRIQLWRRGQQVAMYGGGNQTQLDATTFFEFYGQRNDGKLDRGMYKNAADQPHQLYSLFTDTAAYFLTVSATTNGRRMTELATPTAGTVHPNWLQNELSLYVNTDNNRYFYGKAANEGVFLPWADQNEGFFTNAISNPAATPVVYGADSVFRRASTGSGAWAELLLVGSSGPGQHTTSIAAQPNYAPGVSAPGRLLTTVTYDAYASRRVIVPLLPTDLRSDGLALVSVGVTSQTNPVSDQFRLAYVRIVSPQVPHWRSGQRDKQFFSDSTLAGPAYYVVDSIPASVIGYDVTDPNNVQRSVGLARSGQQRAYGFSGAVGRMHRLVLADNAQPLRPTAAREVRFRSIVPANHNFLIVSNAALMRKVNGLNPVREYAKYRATAGTGHAAHDTLVVTSDQLYDQFHYGERSPLAVRHFAQFMLTANRSERYLLLLGKGVMITEKVGNDAFYRQASKTDRAQVPDLVPASTRGGSDIFFSADWQNNSYVPRIPTGRLPAQTPEQVAYYLEKLKDHEALGPERWRKNLLHLAGGHTPYEQTSFQQNLREYQLLAEKPFFGARVENIYGTSSSTASVNITPQVNAGVSMITYFGHGSTTYLDLTPLDIKLPSSGYSNYRKYPVFYVSGCAAGNTYSTGGSIAEDWILAERKGIVGFLADSDFGYEHEQHEYAKLMYRLMFNDPAWYGKSIPAIQAEVVRQLTSRFSGYPSGQSMLTNMTWQGDPALRMFSPDRPDYQFTPGTTAVAVEAVGSGPVLATSPRFNLRLQLSNPGKIITDSLRIVVGRTVTTGAGSQTLASTDMKIHYYRRDTTVVVAMTNPAGTSVFGNNTFTVKLDDPNVIPELDENNNTATLTYNFLNGGVTPLQPTEFAIVGRRDVRLVGQSNLPQPQPLSYEFELDTIPSFAAPIARTTITATDVATWTPTLPAPAAGRDSVVYYWRFRFAPATAPSGVDVTWASSSFRYINNSPAGWSQSHYGQMASNEKRTVSQAVPGGRWEFPAFGRSVELQTAGGGDGSAATFLTTYGLRIDGQASRVLNCGIDNYPGVYQPNFIAAVFDGSSLRQLANITGGPYQQCGDVGTSTAYYHFASANGATTASTFDDVNTAARQAELLRFLQNVPNGAYVALVSMNRVNFSTMSAPLKQMLSTTYGSRLINTAQDGDPLLMVLRKGYPAQAKETTFNAADTTPRNEQVITLSDSLRSRAGAGTVVSTRIGPAQTWQTLYHTIKTPDAADNYTLKVFGYDQNDVRTAQPLRTISSRGTVSLAGIDAQQYPRLQLEVELRDSVTRTPPQLKQWLVTYQGVPEGVVRRDHQRIPNGAYDAATLSAAATNTGILTIPVYFENVSGVAFSGLTQARAIVSETAAGGRTETTTVWASRVAGFGRLPGADSTALFEFRLNVSALRGPSTVRILANSQELPEQTSINNELNLSFTAPSITVPPTLDVAFDGTHILNGDIVSPSPEILVDVKYEDKRRPLTDPTKVELLLTRPDGGGVAQPISLTGNQAVRFVNDSSAGRTRIYYNPGVLTDGTAKPLTDGVYRLEVQARDMADNQVGAQRYAVSFEVVNQTSITNLFPYPNPITSKARFVFTLTGSSVPRNMKIQILTITGKVVREIMQSELGPLRIGNNITEFAWDGTDQYGDRLANGTYLYRTVLDDPDGQYEHRRTSADQAFKKGWGKLVLLR